jgi:hypothetical protein
MFVYWYYNEKIVERFFDVSNYCENDLPIFCFATAVLKNGNRSFFYIKHCSV